ncbi:MAG: hypothetical protein AAF721_30655, partial [Myxococcota bacterium]
GEYYGRMSDQRRIEVRYPCMDCDSSSAGAFVVKLKENSYLFNHRVAHELGHTYHKRALFGGSGRLAAGEWCGGHTWKNTRIKDGSTFDDADDLPQGNRDGWSETCAASEGWADFFAAATYFSKNAAAPYFRYCRDLPGCVDQADPTINPVDGQQRLEGSTWRDPRVAAGGSGSCVGLNPPPGSDLTNTGHRAYALEGNSARFFWDLYDATGVGDSSDNVTFSRPYMLRVWERFGSGRGHRKRDEPTDHSGDWDDPDGRNAYDYRSVECNFVTDADLAELSAAGHCQAATEFGMNCLTGQDTN